MPLDTLERNFDDSKREKKQKRKNINSHCVYLFLPNIHFYLFIVNMLRVNIFIN